MLDLSANHHLFSLWASTVERSEGKRDADAVYGRVIEAMQESLDRWPDYKPDDVRLRMRGLMAERERLGVSPAAPVGDDPWTGYDVRRLGLKLTTGADTVLVHGDRLYCIQCKEVRAARNLTPKERKLTVSVHSFPDGGPALRTESLTIPAPGHLLLEEASAALIGNCLYVGTIGGVAILPEKGPLHLLTEADGLPGTAICGMAAYGGKLYMALGSRQQNKRALAVYDPETQASRIIASNTALEPERRLHTEREFRIILADESRKCLWIGYDCGVLRYDPESDKLDDAVTTWLCHSANPMVLCPDGLLFLTGYSGLRVADLQTLKTTLLAHGPDIGKDEPPKFANPGVSLWPAWYDGTILITGGGNWCKKPPLYLHRPGEEPAPLQLAARIHILQMTPQGLLALDEQGEGYLILKKEPAH